MTDITIDTGVLMIASGMSDHGCEETCRNVVEAVEQNINYILALDCKDKVLGEYKKKMPDPQCFGRRFVQSMAGGPNGPRTVEYPWTDWRSVRVALNEQGFDFEDAAFVRTAMASVSKRLIAEEAGFYKRQIPRVLSQKAGIKVEKPADAVI
jgi:hypothetical protein